jgi:hypothetical protein
MKTMKMKALCIGGNVGGTGEKKFCAGKFLVLVLSTYSMLAPAGWKNSWMVPMGTRCQKILGREVLMFLTLG